MGGGNHLAMKSLVQLFNEWEIQLLVLVSFTLQFFLFFTGGLRRRIRNSALRSSIWLAYLGADLVAAYVLGLISRQEVSTHHLAFFWAPFLLIHLGGQDTVTAFAIEDNTLWRRHLLDLVVQMSLTLYIFWKSFDGGPNMQLLAPSILLFVTGTIKYGERTWALWCGSLRNIRNSYLRLPETSTDIATSFDPVFSALPSADAMRCFFTGTGYPWACSPWSIGNLRPEISSKLFRTMEIQLGLMFDDIYTKALVLRTWGCTMLRCISHLSFLAAFVLFFSVVRNKKERWHYSSVDTAITYGLFFGGISLEVSSIFVIMMSPWTWAWLKEKTRHCSFLGSIITRCARKRRVWWSNSMGQYNMLSYWQSRKLVKVFFRTGEQKLWISKLLYTKFVQVDEQIMRCVVRRIAQYHRPQEDGSSSPQAGQWQNLGPFLRKMVERHDSDFDDRSIIGLHLFTEVLLRRYLRTRTAMDSESSDASVRVCRMISQYMLYLLVTHPEMLPISSDSGADRLLAFAYEEAGADNDMMHQAILALTSIDMPEPPGECTEAHLLELQEAWVGVLLHAASKSRPEVHAALLAEGGELLTFIWLLMAHYQLGDVQGRPIEMTADAHAPTVPHYAFCFPPQPQAS